MPIDVVQLRVELDALVESERQAIKVFPLIPLAVNCYEAAGGSPVRLRRIMVQSLSLMIAMDLNHDDIPYIPDEQFDPIIFERVQNRIELMIDNLLAGKGIFSEP